MQSNGITHVLNLAIEDVQTGQEFYKDDGAKYFEVFAEDNPEFNLKQCFEHTSDIIENAIKDGGKQPKGPCQIIHLLRTNKHTSLFHILKSKSNTFYNFKLLNWIPIVQMAIVQSTHIRQSILCLSDGKANIWGIIT